MRELLFRGKLVYNSVWVYGGIYKEPVDDIKNGLTYIITSSLSFAGNANIIIPETIGQFTGLLDKNGKKIFEGDIVLIEGHSIGVIRYLSDEALFAVDFLSHLLSLKDTTSEYIAVIGNINDNHELLEKA